MHLKKLIAFLEQQNQEKIVRFGFNNPHSYRGIYAELAFEPAENITVGEMLACAKAALGNTYMGYKGGNFVMDEYTECWLSPYSMGDGETLGPTLLNYMIGAFSTEPVEIEK